jgi:hypothetical protein
MEPPKIFPAGGNFSKPVEVTLQAGPDATVHYTLDGSAPTATDPLYEKPFQLTAPTILRARAFKPGFTRSITALEIFVIDN